MTKYIYLVVSLFFFSFGKIYALDDIKINDETLSPMFDKSTLEYNYYTNKNNIKISISKSSNEIVNGYGNFELNNNDNVFYVTSFIDNIETKYKINVYKNYVKEDEEVITFKSFEIENYDINFKNDIYEYNVDISNDSYLKINYELDNPTTIVKISGNGNFKNGSNKVIVYTSSVSGNNSKRYTIKVNKTVEVFKKQDGVKELTYIQKEIIILIIITISCSLIVFLFYLIFIKKVLI